MLLTEMPIEEIAGASPLLAEAIARLRSGAVIREAGFDGEYGAIRLFAPGEVAEVEREDMLFSAGRRRGAARRPSLL
jgi:PHP family Zn ribbon phosphoesterase